MRFTSAFALLGLAASAMLVKAEEAAAAAPSDVQVLTEKNFADVVPKENLILVEFYAPWCGHCKALAPEYEIAATELKAEIPMAKVDCTVETKLCQDQGVQGYPTLKVFRSGKPVEYNGPRKADGIISYLRKAALPALSEITAADVAAFSQKDKVVVVGVLSKDDKNREALKAVADDLREKYVFAVVDESAAEAQGVKAPAVVLFKSFDEGKNVFEGEFTQASLTEFVKANAVPLVDDIGPDNYQYYMEAGKPLAYLFYDKEEQKAEFEDIKGFAKELKEEANFVYLDANKFGAHAANLGLDDGKWPAFSVQNVQDGSKFPLKKDLTMANIKEHVRGVLSGDVKATLKSEAIPDKQEGPVTVVVGDSYKDVVEDLDKDVLIEFYAPWCGHCKNLAPTYDILGGLYKDSKIVIAKMDATANDLPLGTPFTVPGFPTIKFRKAGSLEYTDYSGNRDIQAFVDFLKENAVNKVDVVVPEVAEKPEEHGHDHAEEEHDHAHEEVAKEAAAETETKPVAAGEVDHDEL
ncbi:protein disulfide-isomerase precursor [Actinomortierella ambigua]|uniref:Protein disulfide-isomerase n=1 Tax=Actinomortierella ambigua TaxID=1343610 RepID=A0A9P6PU10_9FUNG|nr:protein disulfide-isomerase precursor [Actinomortierella ambigua]